jgi:hypothetical protein
VFLLFVTGVIDTARQFAAGTVDTCGKLPPVSTTPAVAVAKFAAGVVDTVSAVPCASISHECYVKYVCLFSRLVSSESIVIDV